MDEKTKTAIKMRTERGSKKCSPCLRFGVWMFACSALLLLALLLSFTLWTLVSYHRTVLSFQERIERLESDIETCKSIDTEQIIETKVHNILKQKLKTLPEVKPEKERRVVRQACSCPPGMEPTVAPQGIAFVVDFNDNSTCPIQGPKVEEKGEEKVVQKKAIEYTEEEEQLMAEILRDAQIKERMEKARKAELKMLEIDEARRKAAEVTKVREE